MSARRGVVDWLYGAKRWMYRGGRPGFPARVLNRLSALQYSAGVLSPARAMTLEVRGRRSGRTVAVPVVVVDYDGGRYLVSMLGNKANWVRNVRAAGGRAVLRRGHPEAVRLVEVVVEDRAPVLRRYVAVAPGARPHIPLPSDAPLTAFERIAGGYPVFRITLDDPPHRQGHGRAGRR
ncbi:hypothetical protein A5730_01240 [Mycobacterium sp. ACS4054]|uniref:nitroreductase family deazaflavin-dependent oxidoreductase n=1 Tax=Mycobacterium sp. ACS4054 TaxID=1834119 RepID=UPI0007FEBCAA|nr:nitroreductase family deazaflavin-dependent oxidoreductase [Mycobacterium sp. ACS4054]OBF05432.1 hypothetical protein A5730_01240 [Mycobacterium sp. ACS4054]